MKRIIKGISLFVVIALFLAFAYPSNTYALTEQTSYVLDKDTMTLTINIFIYGSSTSTVEVTFSVAEDFNSLTHTSGIPGASNYHVNGQTLSVENA